jgi:hypothetical protein
MDLVIACFQKPRDDLEHGAAWINHNDTHGTARYFSRRQCRHEIAPSRSRNLLLLLLRGLFSPIRLSQKKS